MQKKKSFKQGDEVYVIVHMQQGRSPLCKGLIEKTDGERFYLISYHLLSDPLVSNSTWFHSYQVYGSEAEARLSLALKGFVE